MVLEGNEGPGSQSKSFAGTWGEEIRRKKLPVKNTDNAQRFTSVSRESYSLEPFLKQKDPAPNKYNKFQQLQNNGAVIVNKAAYDREEICDEGVFLDSYVASEQSNTPFGKYSLSRPGSRAATGDMSRPATQAGKHSSSPTSHDKLSTVFRDSYRPFTNPSPFDVESSVTMRNTSYRMLRSNDAPIAAGRSGTRTERGVSTSGLLGERLMLTEDPKWNTLAQKSWLYSNDPALMYKIAGVPKAPPVTDRSLTLPCELLNDVAQMSWTNHRRAILTGDLSTSTGRMRAGVFLDEFDPPIKR